MYGCFACMYTMNHMFIWCLQRAEEAADPLELELQMVVSSRGVLRTKPWSCGRAARAPNQRASSSSVCSVLKQSRYVVKMRMLYSCWYFPPPWTWKLINSLCVHDLYQGTGGSGTRGKWALGEGLPNKYSIKRVKQEEPHKDQLGILMKEVQLTGS